MSVALVTGGSRGIGRAVVEALSNAGHSVAFTYIKNADSANELASRCGARAFQADVRDFARAQEVVTEVKTVLGAIDVLVNNAGIRKDKALLKMDPMTWSEVLDTNLTGTFNYSRAVVPEMISRGGVILNVASVSGITGMAGQTNYSAAKAGMIGFTKAMSREVGRFGIRVNAIAPGFIDTDMTGEMEKATQSKLYAQIPQGRPGTAAEVAKMVCYLASADAEYVTGQVFTIDGGLS